MNKLIFIVTALVWMCACTYLPGTDNDNQQMDSEGNDSDRGDTDTNGGDTSSEHEIYFPDTDQLAPVADNIAPVLDLSDSIAEIHPTLNTEIKCPVVLDTECDPPFNLDETYYRVEQFDSVIRFINAIPVQTGDWMVANPNYIAILALRDLGTGPEFVLLLPERSYDEPEGQDFYKAVHLFDEAEATIVDLVYDQAQNIFVMLACQEECFISTSPASPSTALPFVRVPGGTVPPGIEPNAMSSVGKTVFVAGEQVAMFDYENWHLYTDDLETYTDVSAQASYEGNTFAVAVGDTQAVEIFNNEASILRLYDIDGYANVDLNYLSTYGGDLRFTYKSAAAKGKYLTRTQEGYNICSVGTEDLSYSDTGRAWMGPAELVVGETAAYLQHWTQESMCPISVDKDLSRLQLYQCVQGLNYILTEDSQLSGAKYLDCIHVYE